MSLGAVTLDVDAVRHYHAIHGLPRGAGPDAPLEQGVRRFLELCERLELRATIFVVTADLADDGLRALVQRAARAGHEIASHSHGHSFDLSRRAPAEIQSDVRRSAEAIERVVGRRPTGFRAPGYNLSEALLDAIEKAGFLYDSSVMASPLYFAARALAIAAHRARGEASSSIVGRGRAFVAPPPGVYRPRLGALHRRARSRVEGRALVEIPIATMPLGLPWLGSTLSLSPLPVVAAATVAALSSSHACVLELHAIDLCDAADGFASALVRLQPELRVPLQTKLARLESALRMLAQVKEVVSLEEIRARAAT